MRDGFVEKKVGRSLIEYAHPDFEEIIHNYQNFVSVSQFKDQYSDGEVYTGSQASNNPYCGYGEFLYGLKADNKLVLLKAVIDSSD